MTLDKEGGEDGVWSMQGYSFSVIIVLIWLIKGVKFIPLFSFYILGILLTYIDYLLWYVNKTVKLKNLRLLHISPWFKSRTSLQLSVKIWQSTQCLWYTEVEILLYTTLYVLTSAAIELMILSTSSSANSSGISPEASMSLMSTRNLSSATCESVIRNIMLTFFRPDFRYKPAKSLCKSW